MLVFYILLAILILFSLSRQGKLKMGGVSFILLAIVNAFRGESVGSDTINYYNNNFDATFSLDFSSSYELEWLFCIISNGINSLGINSRWCLWILSIITFAFLYLASKRFQRQMELSLVLVALMFFCVLDFFPLSLNIARQVASISIVLYAYSYLYDKKKYMFFFWIFIAMGLHFSSIIFFPIYFLRNINFSNIRFVYIFIAAYIIFFAVFLYKSILLDFITSHFPLVSLYDHLIDKTEETNKSIASVLYEFIKLNINLYIVHNLLKNAKNKFVGIFIISIFVGLLFNAFYGDISRVVLGLSIINVIILASYFSNNNLSMMDKLVYLITLFIYSWTVLRSLSGGAYGIIPYYMTLL